MFFATIKLPFLYIFYKAHSPAKQNLSPNENSPFRLESEGGIPLRKTSRKKRIVLLILAFFLVVFGFRIITLEVKYHALNKQKKELTEQIAQEKLKSKELKEEINNSGSKTYIEYLARKYLGLIYPNEKVYVTDEEEKK